jgi:hypothetical protein
LKRARQGILAMAAVREKNLTGGKEASHV